MGCFSAETDEEVPYQKEIDENFTGLVKSRSATDSNYLYLLIGCLAVVAGLTVYCTINGDTARLLNGYDDCGNVCGIKNSKESDPQFACKGEDMSDKQYLLIERPSYGNSFSEKKRCVESCSVEPNYFELMHRCLPKSDNTSENLEAADKWAEEAFNDLKIAKSDIIKLSIFALAISALLVYLLRLKPEFMVWALLGSFTSLIVLFTVFVWFIWITAGPTPDANSESLGYLTIFMTLITIGVLVVILVMRKRIGLVIGLFKEAGKAIEDMPLLLLQPVWTFVAIVLVLIGYIYIELVTDSAGFIAMDPVTNSVEYVPDAIMQFAVIFDIFMWYWLVQFIIGCQHMIIAGSAATWFFTRDKNQLRSPIRTATGNLFFYHLGSVAIGSLVIAVIQMIRLIFNALKNSMKYSKSGGVRMLYACFEAAFIWIESLLRYWTRNAYVQVAMFGVDFCDGGSRAIKLLTKNLLRVAAINSVGDFVLNLGKMLVVAITVFVGYALMDSSKMQHVWVPLTLVGCIAFVIVHCFMTVYEMVIDTIFLCFCEDCEINDGLSKPYFMSQGLMQFVENSKKILQKSESQTAVNA